MRASATAPSLATSNASRKDLATLQSSARATTILTRVASYSAPKDHPVRCSPGSSLLRSSSIQRNPENAAADTRKDSAVYFSFPSFEDFQDYREAGERRDGRLEKGVS